MRIAITLLFCLALSIQVSATTIGVPQDQPTIQAAINDAGDGDTALVDDGHYYERISFLGKKITVASRYILDGDTTHIYQCIIDGDTSAVPMVADTGSVVRFVNGEDSLSVLAGFTIQNGVGVAGQGGGVYGEYAAATIRNCIIRGNSGGAIYHKFGGPTWLIRNSKIVDNQGDGIYSRNLLVEDSFICENTGSGINACFGSVEYLDVRRTKISNNLSNGIKVLRAGNFYDCLIENNGGGIGHFGKDASIEEPQDRNNRASKEFRNCIVRNNGYGVMFWEADVQFDNCLIEGNTQFGIGIGWDALATVNNCIIRNNGDNNSIGGGIRTIGVQLAGIECSNTLFDGNKAQLGGAIAQTHPCQVSLFNCTFVGNKADSGSAIYQSNYTGTGEISADKCLLTWNYGEVMYRPVSINPADTLKLTISCSNLFGNDSGDWTGQLANYLGTFGNISADPLFCDTANGDYHIRDSSPCASANNSCGTLIGAYGIGCENVAPEITSGTVAEAVKGLPFLYRATSTDQDGPLTSYLFSNLPSWLTAQGDSVSGIPNLDNVDTSFTVNVSDGFLSDTQLVEIRLLDPPYAGPVWHVQTDGDDSLGDGSAASPFASIQKGIDASTDGDTVLVSNGTYHERISFNSKAIVVGSWIMIDGDTLHTLNTVIDGDSTGLPDSDTLAVIRMIGPSTVEFELNGFTVINGEAEGILCYESNLRAINCRSIGNGLRLIDEFGGSVPHAFLNRSVWENCGIEATRFYAMHISHCFVSDTLQRINTGNDLAELRIDSSTVGAVVLGNKARVYARKSTFNGSFSGTYLSRIYPIECRFSSIMNLGNESFLIADSCVFAQIVIRQENTIELNRSLIQGSLAYDYVDIPSVVSLTNCSLTEPIVRIRGRVRNLVLDSCIIDIPAPLQIDDYWYNLSLHCTNIYTGGGPMWTVDNPINLTLDTSNVFSLPPLFCDTASGDFSLKNSSPCAPNNNSCGVLIGAYGIGCANIAPTLTSADSVQAVSGLRFVYKATSTDPDGPDTTVSFTSYPSWLTAQGDSAFGMPPLTDFDTSFTVIVSDGFLADTQLVTLEIIESPILSQLTTEGALVAMNVISHTPSFGWQYFDTSGSYPQTQFEIAVGSDADWTYAELWNPAPFSGAATSKQYAGATLVDGQTYWVRVRVSNSLHWSNWKETSFRMNSIPTTPQLRLPVDNSIVNTEHPNLTLRNPIDAENDSTFLTFELSADSFATSYVPFEIVASNDSLTTVAVPVPLNENMRFWWRVKASDYFEESGYSPIWSFWANQGNSAPAAFGLLSPPNTPTPALSVNLPEFTWQNSLDVDPWDSVEFTLQLSVDSSFSFVNQISGLTNPNFVPSTSFEWGRRYWWRVKAEDNSTGVTWANETFSFRIMALGDADGSGVVTISDAVLLISYIFGGGEAPSPIDAADADCNGLVTISDAVYLINFIFAGGPPPCEGR